MKKIILKESELVNLIKGVINETTPTGCHVFKGRGVWPSQPTICTGGSRHKIYSHNMDNNQWYSFLGNPSIGDKVRFTRADGGPPPEWVLEYLGTDCSERIGLVPDPNGPAVPCGQGPTGGCDATAWSGYNTWISNWTNSGPFNSQNQNQPCNHICKQINTWTNKLTNAGTTQANQLNCKIDEGNNQSQIHGCNC